MTTTQSNKLFDRSSYSSTTISTYQIVGAYFVDVYYNHLYTEAIKFKTNGNVVSVTEGYRHATFAFLSALDIKAKGYKKEHYNKLLQGINEYFVYWTTYSSLTLSDCIDKIVKEFVPADYFQSLTKEQKRNILRSILIDSIRDFTKVVIGEYLGAIIDNHDESANVEALKEKIVDIFIMRRETMFHKFLDCRAGGSPNNETIDKKFVEKLRGECVKLGTVNEELFNQNKELTNQLNMVNGNASEIIQRFKKLKMRHDSLAQELQICKQKNAELEELLKQAQSNVHTTYSTPYSTPSEPQSTSTYTRDSHTKDLHSTKDSHATKDVSRAVRSVSTPPPLLEDESYLHYDDPAEETHSYLDDTPESPPPKKAESKVTKKSAPIPRKSKPAAKKSSEPVKSYSDGKSSDSKAHPESKSSDSKSHSDGKSSDSKSADIKIPEVKNSFKQEEVEDNELDLAAKSTHDIGFASSISDIY